MKITVYANRISIGKGNPDPPPLPKRGDVRGLSKASRRRLMDKINSVRNLRGALFITLTYPDHFPRHPIVWKQHIAAFRKRLKRQYPNVGGVWRLELKERKSGVNMGKTAPHFHLICRGMTGSLKRTRAWVKVAWYEIVQSGDQRHLRAGTEVDPCKNRNHAAWYVAKYVAKEDDGSYTDSLTGEKLWTGRLWGVFGWFVCEPYIEGQISHSRFLLIKSWIARWLREDGQEDYAKTIENAEHGINVYRYGPEGERWPQLVKLLNYCGIKEINYVETE